MTPELTAWARDLGLGRAAVSYADGCRVTGLAGRLRCRGTACAQPMLRLPAPLGRAKGDQPVADDLDQLCINTIRTLAMDAVQQANSGHPGTPMGAGAGRLHAVERAAALRPGRPDLAQPRPLRALGRARLDAALCAAAPDADVRRSTSDYEPPGGRR